MSSPKLPPLPITLQRSNSVDTKNKTNPLDAPLTPDVITLTSSKETSTTPNIQHSSWNALKINIDKYSHNNSSQQQITPLTPLEYDDKLEYTPPSKYMNKHKPEFSMSGHSTSTNNTMKTKLTLEAADSRHGFNIEPQCIKHNISGDLGILNEFSLNNLNLQSHHTSRRSTLHSIGFSPFDPTDINALHPNEVEKALNMIHTTELQTKNSFQHEHIAPFAKQSHSALNRRVSGTTSSYYKSNTQQLRHRVSEIQTNEKQSEEDNIESVPCIEGCCNNICLNGDFWYNKYNIFRMFMLCVVIVFIIVCILYAIGQLSRLELDDYLCDMRLDIEDIHRYNKDRYSAKGDKLSCYTTENGIINEGKLYKTKDIVYSAVFDVNIGNVFKMLSFIIIGLFLCILVLMIHCIQLFNDLRRFYFAAWVYIYFRQKRSKANNDIKCNDIVNRITNNKCIKLYKKHFSADRIGWVFYLMLRECIEVFIQTMALLSYGGFNHKKKIYLAEKPLYIMIFSAFLTMNCLSVGIIWSLYICCHDSFQGRYFNGIILMVDSIFDIFYSFFPLIIRNHNGAKDLLFFSSFQSYSLIGYLSMIIPLIFLSSKMFTVLNFLSSKSRKDWRLLFDERLWYKMQRELARLEPHKHDSLSQVRIKTNPGLSTQHAFTIRHNINEAVIAESPEEEAAAQYTPTVDQQIQTPIPRSINTPISIINRPPITLQNAVSNTNTNQRKSNTVSVASKENKKVVKSMDESICCSLCSGPKYLSSPLPDRRFSPSAFCIQVIRRAIVLIYGIILICYGSLFIIYISHHFSLSMQTCTHKLWKYCTHKVYPFGDRCQCRSFFMSSTDFVESADILMQNENILSSLFSDWWMLQMIVLDNNGMNGNISIVLNNVDSIILRILSIRNINVYIVDNGIFSIWRDIEFFQIDNGLNNTELVIGDWNNLKYLSLIGSNIASINSCSSLNKLQYLSLENSSRITDLRFDCLNKYIKYINLVRVNVLNVSLFTHFVDLRQYIHYLASIHHIEINYNENTMYYLQGTTLCKEAHYSYACQPPFDGYDLKQLSVCPPMKWMNGICDEECNNKVMRFDGGDCAQLCDFNQCDILKQWIDDECNEECNQTQCLYDQYQCIL